MGAEPGFGVHLRQSTRLAIHYSPLTIHYVIISPCVWHFCHVIKYLYLGKKLIS
jgi:hypothetical protein